MKLCFASSKFPQKRAWGIPLFWGLLHLLIKWSRCFGATCCPRHLWNLQDWIIHRRNYVTSKIQDWITHWRDVISSGLPRGGGVGVWGVQLPLRTPSKIVPNLTRLWKLLKIAEFRTPTPQDVRKKRQLNSKTTVGSQLFYISNAK